MTASANAITRPLADHLGWLDAFLLARGAPVSGDEILAAVAEAAAEVLTDEKDLQRCLSP